MPRSTKAILWDKLFQKSKDKGILKHKAIPDINFEYSKLNRSKIKAKVFPLITIGALKHEKWRRIETWRNAQNRDKTNND